MLLEDKVVIVTGVGPGMGRKLGSLAAAEGAKVVLAARSADFLDAVAEEIRASGGDCIAIPTDIADTGQCENLVAAAMGAFGRVDGLVNSAYKHASYRSFEDDDIATWLSSMDVTCFGALRMIKAALPALKAAGRGHRQHHRFSRGPASLGAIGLRHGQGWRWRARLGSSPGNSGRTRSGSTVPAWDGCGVRRCRAISPTRRRARVCQNRRS